MAGGAGYRQPRRERGVRPARWRHVFAALLISPLFVFLGLTFLLPIGRMLVRAVENPEMAVALPETARVLKAWTGDGLPPEVVARILVAELPEALKARTLAIVAQRLNHDVPGFRSLMLATGRALAGDGIQETEQALARLAAIDPRWADPATWVALRRAALPVTDLYLLSALDRDRDGAGRIVAVPAGEAIFGQVLVRTLTICASVTGICLVLGFPVAFLLAHAPTGRAHLLLILVLLPFWTSLLVRTSAWVVLLQNAGIVNGLLLGTGLVDQPVPLVFNRFGVVVAMSHVLLPFMILPLYSVMRGIPPSYTRAALSLGAPPWLAFVRVYLPQAMPGVGAGALLVFILALGYYVTPALVGGADDQMISYFIAFYTNRTVNWGLAAALSAILLAATVALCFVYASLARAAGLRLG
jgi:putative spermidine/putrescine transport system permease protein